MIFLRRIQPAHIAANEAISKPKALAGLFAPFFIKPKRRAIHGIRKHIKIILKPKLARIRAAGKARARQTLYGRGKQPIAKFVFRKKRIPSGVAMAANFFNSRLFGLRGDKHGKMRGMDMQCFPFIFMSGKKAAHFML